MNDRNSFGEQRYTCSECDVQNHTSLWYNTNDKARRVISSVAPPRLARGTLAMRKIVLATGQELTIRQKLVGHNSLRVGGPGGSVWPCGEATAQWLAEQRAGVHPSPEQAITEGPLGSVIELGAGTGLVSIALSLMGASRVVATDGDAASCELCQKNAEESGGKVSTCRFIWGSAEHLDDTLALVGEGSRCANWIVGADVLYNRASTAALELTLRQLLARGGCSLVVIGWVSRGQDEERFLYRLRDLGTVATVERYADSRFNYLTKRNGRVDDAPLEFGVTVLRVHKRVQLGLEEGGAVSRLRQRLGIFCAHALSSAITLPCWPQIGRERLDEARARAERLRAAAYGGGATRISIRLN